MTANRIARPGPAPIPAGPSLPWRQSLLAACLLLGVVVCAYQPVWHAGFVWDDDAHVLRPGMATVSGLWRIWSDPGSTQQYYPVLYSAFWLEHRLWGAAPLGYHLLNVGLHGTVALLLFRVLRTLAVPGALLGAVLFAVHPVFVESVAWVSEQKNTLSGVFCLMATLAYLRFDADRKPRSYALACVWFVLAVLSKSVTATLPAALLVLQWWRRGRLSWRTDARPLVPWLAFGACAGACTAWLERTHVGAVGAGYNLSAPDRILVAGRALWFYLGKLAWPTDLAFVYPRWAIDAHDPAQYLYPVAALAVVAGAWAARGRSRGPLATALLFAGTLFPALGFVNVFPFIYSFVADHFQYLAGAAVLSAASAGIAIAAARLPATARTAAWFGAACGAAVLGALSWRQCREYENSGVLWRATIARNPMCWMAYNNLASDLLAQGRAGEAIADARKALAIEPTDAAAFGTLGNALIHQGRVGDAIAQYERALEIEPNNALFLTDLGNALAQAGRSGEAIARYERAIELAPDLGTAHVDLGNALLGSGRPAEAVAEYGRALSCDPTDGGALENRGVALLQLGRNAEALADLARSAGLSPHSFSAQLNLGNALMQAGRVSDALESYRAALAIDPSSSAVHNNLGYALLRAGRPDEAVPELRRALELDPGNAAARRNFEAAVAGK